MGFIDWVKSFGLTDGKSFGVSGNKSFGAQPLQQKAKTSRPQEMLFRFLGDGTVVWYENTGQNQIEKGYLGNHVIFSIQDWKSSKVASVPAEIYLVKDQKKYNLYRTHIKSKSKDGYLRAMDLRTKAMDLVADHPASKVLENPNPMMTRYEFEYGLQVYIDCVGSGYIEGVRDGIVDYTKGAIKEMWLPPAHKMVIVSGGVQMPIKQYYLNSNPEVKIDAANVCQIRNFSPKYETETQWLYGLSRLYSAQGLIQKYANGQEAEMKLYQDGGVRDIIFPKGIEDPNSISVEQVQQVQDTFNRRLRETGQGGMMANSIELGHIQVGFSPKDMMILENNDASKEDFCALYHIHPGVFGWGDDSTFSNQNQYVKMAIRDAVLPELERRKDAYNSWLLPSYSKTGDRSQYVVDYDLEFFPELQEDRVEVVKWIEKTPLTGNEIRVAMGYDTMNEEFMKRPMISSNAKFVEDMGMDSFGSTNPNDGNLFDDDQTGGL